MVEQRDGVGPRTRRATLRDVGALAGVSFKTVSRVVNGEPGVSEELAARVREAARQLNSAEPPRACCGSGTAGRCPSA